VVEEFGATAVDPDAILFAEADILSPCALGAVFDDASIPRLRTRAIAGAANNQLAEARHGRALHARGILYTPDYVVNAGGLIDVALEGPSYDPQAVLKHCERIYDTSLAVFARAEAEGMPTADTADRMAEEIFRHPAGDKAVEKAVRPAYDASRESFMALQPASRS
jgi:leucine dehydrogenase